MTFAEKAGLSGPIAEGILQDRAYRDAVESAWVRSRELDMVAAPTFLMNDQRLVGAQPYEALRRLLAATHVERRFPEAESEPVYQGGRIWPPGPVLGSAPLERDGRGEQRLGGIRFVADSMLGSLAKWLRVLGCDTHYQRWYPPGAIEDLLREGRVLLTRDRRRADQAGKAAVFISADRVGDQLIGLTQELGAEVLSARWFSRCLLCNCELQPATAGEALEHVPEYVFHQDAHHIRFCPSCGRYFWPGTHRRNMESQLKAWGFERVHE